MEDEWMGNCVLSLGNFTNFESRVNIDKQLKVMYTLFRKNIQNLFMTDIDDELELFVITVLNAFFAVLFYFQIWIMVSSLSN